MRKESIPFDEQYKLWYDAADKYFQNCSHLTDFNIRDIVRNSFVAGAAFAKQSTYTTAPPIPEGGC